MMPDMLSKQEAWEKFKVGELYAYSSKAKGTVVSLAAINLLIETHQENIIDLKTPHMLIGIHDKDNFDLLVLKFLAITTTGEVCEFEMYSTWNYATETQRLNMETHL